MFPTVAYKQEKKKKGWKPHVLQPLHQAKVDDSNFTSNEPKVINK